MAYCSWTDVTDILKTTMGQTAIENIIAESDAEIDSRLGTQTAGDLIIQKLSKLMSAIQVKSRQPTSMAAGMYRETHDPVVVWSAEVERIFTLNRAGVVMATPYEHIDEDDRYTEDVVEE